MNETKRPISPGAEKHVEVQHDCLDHGFVRLVDYLGGDARIVQSARVSYGEGTKTVREDAALIGYLLSHKHTSPFEQVVFTFHLKMPIFVARQWMRHRTARANEISGRYSILPGEFYLPQPEDVRFQSKSNRQGRSDEEVPLGLKDKVVRILRADQSAAYADYKGMLDDDIARELARIGLPLSLYTELYWQIDLHNLLHFLRLRIDAHAQYEIRVYGEALAAIVRDAVPMAYAAFEEHVLHARTFSRSEMKHLLAYIDHEKLNDDLQNENVTKRFRRELLNKLDPNLS